MKKNRRLRNAAEPQSKLERNYFCHDDGGTTAVSSLNFGTGPAVALAMARQAAPVSPSATKIFTTRDDFSLLHCRLKPSRAALRINVSGPL